MTPTEEEATGAARRAFQKLLDADKTRREGWRARDDAIISLAATGMSHRHIARVLREQAEAANLTADQIAALGISEGNVFTIIRTAKAGKEGAGK